MINLKFQAEQDRDTVAFILIKNGYLVTPREIFNERGEMTSFGLCVEDEPFVSEAKNKEEEQSNVYR